MKKAVPPTGWPIAPSSISLRQVWCAPPRKVSGAQPTRSPFAAARLDELRAVREGDAERLLRMDVLAGGDRLQADLDMRLRHGEVEHDLDRRIGEQRVDRTRRHAELRRARLRRRRIGVGERVDVEDRETFAPPSDRRELMFRSR